MVLCFGNEEKSSISTKDRIENKYKYKMYKLQEEKINRMFFLWLLDNFIILCHRELQRYKKLTIVKR